MKQKIKVALSRTNWDGAYVSWQENKVVEIEVDNPELDRTQSAMWHVAGEMVGDQE